MKTTQITNLFSSKIMAFFLFRRTYAELNQELESEGVYITTLNPFERNVLKKIILNLTDSNVLSVAETISIKDSLAQLNTGFLGNSKPLYDHEVEFLNSILLELSENAQCFSCYHVFSQENNICSFISLLSNLHNEHDPETFLPRIEVIKQISIIQSQFNDQPDGISYYIERKMEI